ncbi:MAG: RsmF rRNA methyltransferase first C-terminal domain-containing protein [Lachnospiraceae bacterium]|nr:RsmF rRNA methyltransferase first C-terminal domain-containing protein [Lachnospiraceae bacterium]
MQFPESFTSEMKELLKDEYDAFLESYKRPVASGIRANTLKTGREELKSLLDGDLEEVPWCENGLFSGTDSKYSSSPYYYAGLYYIQEPSAMLPAAMLAPEPGDRVLDLCAAPGGKSTALGAYLKGQGVLVSNDVSPSRARALVKNMEIFGIRNSVITCEMPEKLAEIFPEYFDRILVDAPCSGEGMFHKKPSMTEFFKEYGPEYYNSLQRPIILNAARMLRPGGTMVYSTCTFSRLENESTIDWLLENMPEFEVVEMKRMWPHKVRGEGHFAALLRKNGETERKPAVSETATGSDIKELNDFLGEYGISCSFSGEPRRNGDNISIITEAELPEKGLRILKNGWYLGKTVKGRFEPSESFAMGLDAENAENRICLDPDDIRVTKYLKGETLDIAGSAM